MIRQSGMLHPNLQITRIATGVQVRAALRATMLRTHETTQLVHVPERRIPRQAAEAVAQLPMLSAFSKWWTQGRYARGYESLQRFF